MWQVDFCLSGPGSVWSTFEELVRGERHDVELAAVAAVRKQSGLVVETNELTDRMLVVEQL